MRNIKGHYQIEFKQVDYDVMVPGDWHELDSPQYAAVMELLTYKKADRFTLAASLLSILFGPKNWHILNNLCDEDLYELTGLTNFLFETTPPANNYFPKLKIRKREHFAPAADLGNISFGEWCFLYQFYIYYRQSNEVAYLNRLVATLYRPADPNQNPTSPDFSGDTREKFNENLIEDRARGVQDIESKFKQAILGWVTAAISLVAEARPNAFPVASEGSEDQSESGEASNWFSIFRELLGPKWGTTEQLKHTNAMFVLDHLEEEQINFKKASRPANA